MYIKRVTEGQLLYVLKNVQLCSILYLVHSLTQNWRVKSVISLPAQCKVLLVKLTTTLSLKEFPTFSNPKVHHLVHDIHAYCQQAAQPNDPYFIRKFISILFSGIRQSDFFAGSLRTKSFTFLPATLYPKILNFLCCL